MYSYIYKIFYPYDTWFNHRIFSYTVRIRTVITYFSVVLGGLVVSMLATGPKVRGFDPGRGRWIFKGF
jgi:hypothetical protein